MINEFSPSRFRELINEGVGALLIVIPSDLESLTEDMKEVENLKTHDTSNSFWIYQYFVSVEHH